LCISQAKREHPDKPELGKQKRNATKNEKTFFVAFLFIS